MHRTLYNARLLARVASEMPYYAVKRGKNPGVYDTWPKCEEQVKGFNGARYKKFNTEGEAWNFVNAADSPRARQSFHTSPTENGTPQKQTKKVSPAASAPTVAPSIASSLTAYAASITGAIATLPSTSEGCPTISSTRLLALKGTLRNISQTVAQLQQYCTQAEQQLDQIGKKKRPAAATHDSEPPVSRRRDSSNVDDSSSTTTSINSDGLPVSDDGYINVYTDGCCHNNGRAGAVAGIGVYWAPGHPLNVSEPLPGKPTNNRAEIHAACRAAIQAKEQGITKLAIHTDSQFTINGITKWIHKWKKNGWKLTGGGDVINKDDFLVLDNAITGLQVKWIHVRGHMGDPGNEMADCLANNGARS